MHPAPTVEYLKLPMFEERHGFALTLLLRQKEKVQ